MVYKAFIVLGSFKTRGIVNQFAHIPAKVIGSKRNLVSISAGNYGKAFAIATKKQNLPATLCMPETAAVNRVTLIEVYLYFSQLSKGKLTVS